MPKARKGLRGAQDSNFILQGGILAIAGIVTRIIGLLYRVPVTNIIGDEGNGYYAAAYQIYNILLLISSYSLPLAISKLVSARYSKGQYKNADRVYKGGLIFAFCTGGIVCLLVLFGAEFFAGVVMSEPMSYIALRIFAPTLLVVAVMGVVRGYFQGMGTMVPTAVSQIIEQIMNAVVSILAAHLLFSYGEKVGTLLRDKRFAPAYGAAGSTLGTSMGATSGLIFLIVALMMVSNSLKHDMADDETRFPETYRRILKTIVMTAVPVIMSTAIYNLSDVLDNGIFNRIMTAKGLAMQKTAIWGVYSGKYKLLINVPIALSNAMSSSVVPTLSASVAREDFKMARRKISSAMRFTMILSFPCAVGLAVLAEPIMGLLFRGETKMAAELLRAGAISIIFFSISTLTNGILQGINHLELPVRHSAMSLVLHLIMLVCLLQGTDIGIYAVLCSNTLFAFTMCILNHLSIKRYLRYRQEIRRTFFVPFISAAIMGLIVFFLYRVLSAIVPIKIIPLAISIGCGGFVYFLLIIILGGVKKSEIRALRK